MIDVDQRLVAFDQNRQRQPVAQRQIGAAVGDGVRPALVGDRERFAHAGARFDVPLPGRFDARLLPESQFQGIGPRFVTATDKPRLRVGNLAHRLHGRGISRDPRRVVFGSDDDEVVEHHGPALGSVPLLHKGLFRRGAVRQDHVGFAPFAQLQGGPGADGNRLEGVPSRVLEERTEGIEQTGIGRAGRRRQDDIPRTRAGHRCRRLLRRERRRRETNGRHHQEDANHGLNASHGPALRAHVLCRTPTSPSVRHDRA